MRYYFYSNSSHSIHYSFFYSIYTMDTPQYDASPNMEQTLEELLESFDRYTTLRRQIADLDKKVDQLMELIAGNAHGKKRSQEEASVSETPPTARVHVNAGAEII